MTGEPQAIYAAMHSVMSEIGSIGKDGVNEFQKYRFRGIAQVIDAVTPLLIKHRVIMIPQYGDLVLHPQDKGFTATCKLQLGFISIEDGSNLFYSAVGQGADSSDKAANKAMSAAFKYALVLGLGIRENEVGTDADSDSPSVTPKKGGEVVAAPGKKPTVRNMLAGE